MDPIPDPSERPVSSFPGKEVIEAELRFRRQFTIGVIVTVICLAAGAVGARPTWRAIKAWRAQRMIQDGQRLLAEHRHEQAFGLARSALQIAPVSADAMRLAARSLAADASPLALGYWRRLHQMTPGSMTADDRIGLVEAALRAGDPTLAEEPIAALLSASNPPPAVLRLAAQHRLASGDLGGSTRFGRELLRLEPDNPTNILGLASVLAAAPDPAARGEARTLFWKAADTHPASRLQALEALVVGPAGNADDARRISQELAESNNPSIRTRILAAEASIKTFPALRGSIARGQIASLEPTGTSDIVRIVTALSRHQEYAAALPHLSRERAATNAALFRLRIACLAGSGDNEAAYLEMLSPPKDSGIDPLELEMERFRLARKLPDSDPAEEHRRRLLPAAGRDPRRLRALIGFAETRGLTDLAVEACQAWAAIPGETTAALQRQVGIHDRAGDLAGARQVARRIAQLQPGDPAPALRAAHFDALLGDNLQAALATAQPLFEHPKLRLDARFTAALAHVRLKDPTKATEALAVPFPEGQPLGPAQTVVLIAVHGLAGRTQAARLLAQSIPLDRLRQEEKDLIRPYLPPASPLQPGTPSP